MFTSWVVANQLRGFRETVNRFPKRETYYLWVAGAPGSSKKKGQEGMIEVTDIRFGGYYDAFQDRPADRWDPSFMHRVYCRMLTEADAYSLGERNKAGFYGTGDKLFPATIKYVSRSGKVTSVIVMGEAKVGIETHQTQPGQIDSVTLAFEARRLHVNAPAL